MGQTVPARGVCGDGLVDRGGEVVPQVPPIGDLHHARVSIEDGLGVGRRAITAYDLDTGMRAQPAGQGGGRTVWQYVDPLVGDRVE